VSQGLANTAMRFRLYPAAEQAERLTAWSHTCRAVWNIALAQRIWAYKSAQQVTLNFVTQGRELTEARREYEWLRDLPADCAHRVLRQLDAAYANFWNPSHPAGFPQFKKKTHRTGISFLGPSVKVRKVSRRMALVCLPKLGWVKFRASRPLDPRAIRNATVSRDGLGWHIAFGIHVPEPDKTLAHSGPAVGVDVGIACSVFLSTEDKPRQRPSTLRPGEQQRVRGLERRKARQIRHAKKHAGGRYSKRLRKTIAVLAAVKAQQARRRGDWNHKLTNDLAKNHGLIVMEALRVSNMVRSARGSVTEPGKGVRRKAGLNRSISDQGWAQIRAQLSYKTKRFGGSLLVVNAAGTSQTCRVCHERDPLSREGCGRLFACVYCGHTEHADLNAAHNILERGLIAAGRAGRTTDGRGEAQSTHSRRKSATPRKGAARVNHFPGSTQPPGESSRFPAGVDVNQEGGTDG
jgi:putative transposase